MEKLEQIIDLLKGLSDDEIEKIKSSLKSNSETENVENVEEPPAVEVEEKEEENSNEIVDSGETTETDQEEQKKDEDEQVIEDSEETQTEELESSETEQTGTQQVEMEEIPKMQRGEQVEDEDIVVPQQEVEDNSVEKDNIIEAQKAKITALEAELATLKSKVDGAFGYSSKVSIPTKTNRLYDDCSDVHIHR